ncbi:MAG: hypothetical protein PWP03_61 [Candidatus Woesearchaeota archaeon]|nr:hypothetical protein [Candidatus Woesearchaeota archaeon]MDN5327423.1 hypothetical protein [Candidatus Woesearchaeota archaeon]
MAKRDQIRVPMSMGGLIRYNDEFKSNFQISPGAVIALAIILIILVLILNNLGVRWLGVI